MASITQPDTSNLLLSVLNPASFAALQPHFERADLPIKTVLVADNEPTTHVYSMESGLASMVARSEVDGEKIELGHFGRERMVGHHLVHGTTTTPQRTFMQVGGSALRLPTEVMTDVLGRNEPLRALLLLFAQSYEIQISQSALASGRYNINERLARWLLMSHDRMESDDLPLTHEFLSVMLGVRRSGVSNEIHILEGVHLIKATRAKIKILNREGLEDLAGGCYGVAEAEYERLIGIPIRRQPSCGGV